LPSDTVWPVASDRRWQRQFRNKLLAWYDGAARDLPWRRTRDPYAVWVSEIMLQQTQVATVIPYFERFLAAFPNIESLAAAHEQDVLRLWEGLGYYRRARQMHRAAAILAAQHAGQFPRDPAVVRSLPGIGRYTAGAILSIAFDDRQPILEANTLRLLSRLLAYRGDPRSAQGQRLLWSFAEEILPSKRAGTMNQALMELGSGVCKPRNPLCDDCPLADLCPTREQGLQQSIPAAAPKTRYEEVRETAFVVWHRKKVLIRQCQPDERWAGLWDFPRCAHPGHAGEPSGESLARQLETLTGVRGILAERLTTFRYGVTRFRITLSCFHVHHTGGRASAATMRWIAPEQLADIPLSVTGRKISRLLAKDSERGRL
jgi:A/G-specific adenine glycosylase